jgi:subtilisin-like proprotein convertase family protein
MALIGVIALALSVTGGLGATADAAKKKGKANKARTFRSNAPQAIPDRAAGPTAPFGQLTSTINVGKVMKGKEIADIDVGFSATGPADRLDDLDVSLLAPNGARVFLAGDNGGTPGTTSYGTGNCATGATTFSDETANFISNDGPPALSPFEVFAPWAAVVQPQGYPLSILDGGRAKGTWRLVVFDVDDDAQLTLNCWKLTIKPRNPLK